MLKAEWKKIGIPVSLATACITVSSMDKRFIINCPNKYPFVR